MTEDGLNFLGTFLDIKEDPYARVLCCGERGLLGLAFHPNYAVNRYFYVYYTAKANSGLGLEDGDLVIARYRAPTPDSNSGVDPNTESILLKISHSTHSNHNGGGLAFGPDGYLYVAVGDGGGGGDPQNSGQSLTTLLGKILRLAVDVSGARRPTTQSHRPTRSSTPTKTQTSTMLSGRGASAIRGASLSTGRRATSSSPTWVRRSARR